MKINGLSVHSYQAPERILIAKNKELPPLEPYERLPEDKFKPENLGEVIDLPGTKYKAVFLKKESVERVLNIPLRAFWNHSFTNPFQESIDPIENHKGYLLAAYRSEKETKQLLQKLSEMSPNLKLRLPQKNEDKRILTLIKNSVFFKKSGLVDFKCSVNNNDSKYCLYQKGKKEFSIIGRSHVENTGIILLIQKED